MLEGGTHEYKVKVYDVGVAQGIVTDNDIGRNDASIDEVKSSFVFGLDDNGVDNCDITMIIGEFACSPEKVLLNMRFHQKLDGAKEFGEKFLRYAMKNIHVGKGFKEVRLLLFLFVLYYCGIIFINLFTLLHMIIDIAGPSLWWLWRSNFICQ